MLILRVWRRGRGMGGSAVVEGGSSCLRKGHGDDD